MENFDDYVRARGDALMRFAYLLCGDRHRAEDFVQEALIRCHRRWRAIERDGDPEPYVRKAVLRQFLSWRRRKVASEHVADEMAKTASGTDTAQAIAERDAMWRVLATLPRRQRAVLVLRYYEDLPDAQVAELLGCSAATVRVHVSRALAKLREHPGLPNFTIKTEERV
ncbi:SigE family RNA polymerase sigma factor [Stackebrandtia nassauensis]|uniref:Transcriptional regulator, LuxR family n=1 Tax=Stackebrandtia nassauensis (strain DSM 44728 / CIP 108903 / NRRL B-16338 / NBRC 102104 / LLR-40K-21) TaxID=446470 RepID=D3QAZ1_STANL|nr:SigE family RNA polymerase sigma factor [Stackebrandtia nassauensis]ADD44787.1 transcriptional regulator, LuxR family [Stackebrandtia nassauensis DSM 44728]